MHGDRPFQTPTGDDSTGDTQDRLALGLAHWPALAAAAGLPEGGWRAVLLASRRDRHGDRVVIRMDHAEHPPVICKQGLRPADVALTAAAATAQRRAAGRMAGLAAARVPAILACLPDQGALAMQAVEGDLLTSRIEAGMAPRALSRAGEWVDAFHRTGPVEPRAFRPRFLIDHLGRIAGAVRRGERAIPRPRRFCAHVADLAGRAAAVQGAPTLASVRHGDLNGRNLILGRGMVWGIDFAEAGIGPVGFDIARLLVHLAERLPRPRVEAPVPPDMAAAFFAGYRLIPPQDATLGFLIRARVLANWAGMPADEEAMSVMQMLRFRRILALADAPEPQPE